MTGGSSSFSGKKGICFLLKGEHGDENLEKVRQLETSWYYGWGAEKSGSVDGSEFVPMVWGAGKTLTDRLASIHSQIDEGSASKLLGFNEPDKKEQSNMSVDKAIEFWPQLEALNVPLCSPSCANPLSCEKAESCTQGVSGCWMRDFMNQARKLELRVDYIGVHWYGGPNFAGFKKRMRDIHEAYDLPLILTEFAVADWKAMGKTTDCNKYKQSQVLEFMKVALPWLEAQDWIFGYAWFPFKATCPQGTCSALFTKQGKLTALGRYYASINPENPSGNQDEKVWCD